MALKPGYLVQPRAAEVQIGLGVWEPITSKKKSDEVLFEKRESTKQRREKRQSQRSVTLAEFLYHEPVDETEEESQETEPDALPQASIEYINERMKLLEIALERAKMRGRVEQDWEKIEAEDRAVQRAMRRKEFIFSRTVRSTKRN